MMQAVIAAAAALAGILLGFWMRSNSARSEKALLEQQAQKALADLTSTRSELASAQSAAAARAGFESLAAEREKTILQRTEERDRLNRELQARNAEASQSAGTIAELNTKLINEQKNMAEKVALLDTARKTLADQFQALAADILDQKSKSFAEGSQKEIGTLLNPLRTQIEDFRKKVEEAQTDSKTGVTRLETLVTALNGLNQQISEDARNLTTALRGSAKTQGDWGEFILRDLLDKAGLREGEQYSFQQNFTGVESENGERSRSVRTDVIIFLPGGRDLVIDSKVSLTAYTDCVSATADDLRKAALKLHLASVRGHMAGLSKAGYHRLPGVEAPDFVVMFVPVEPAFLMALQNDSDLWADAYKQGILLVGPTTLLYVIRIVNVLWQQELQARSVQDVMSRGTALYEKFVGFVNDLEAVGKSLRNADQSYDNAMKKLTEGPGNLIRQVELLKKLGIRTSKALPKNLLDSADLDEPVFSLAAEAEEPPADLFK
ncbi:MAG TPA: DNA recombination protein RmuC [Terracidiphilus sp.]|jgi:DNA recombination protein RmuC|nr:DNA recombination protein RmuC [Terracidiphilus sp.]